MELTDVEAEAKRLAMQNAGRLMLAMSESGISERELAEDLGVSIRSLRFQLRGENWRGFLPLAAICLRLGVRIDSQVTRRE